MDRGFGVTSELAGAGTSSFRWPVFCWALLPRWDVTVEAQDKLNLALHRHGETEFRADTNKKVLPLRGAPWGGSGVETLRLCVALCRGIVLLVIDIARRLILLLVNLLLLRCVQGAAIGFTV